MVPVGGTQAKAAAVRRLKTLLNGVRQWGNSSWSRPLASQPVLVGARNVVCRADYSRTQVIE